MRRFALQQNTTNHNKTDETGGGKPLFSYQFAKDNVVRCKYQIARRGVKHGERSTSMTV
jgi:hypothetical protein